MTYTTLADLKSYLNITVSTDDTLLTALITRAQAVIDVYTDRHFEAETTTKYFHIEDLEGQILYLYDNDLLTITTLVNGNGTVIDAASYRLEPRNSEQKWMIRLNGDVTWEFTDGDSEISVSGTWGWSATAPANIVHAATRLAAFIYRQKDSSTDIDRPIITGDGVTIMPGALPQDVMRLLDPYRRRI